MTQRRMDRAALKGIELEYEIRGAGEPVVLVHGGVFPDFFRPPRALRSPRRHAPAARGESARHGRGAGGIFRPSPALSIVLIGGSQGGMKPNHPAERTAHSVGSVLMHGPVPVGRRSSGPLGWYFGMAAR
jgi:hypothetical protein